MTVRVVHHRRNRDPPVQENGHCPHFRVHRFRLRNGECLLCRLAASCPRRLLDEPVHDRAEGVLVRRAGGDCGLVHRDLAVRAGSAHQDACAAPRSPPRNRVPRHCRGRVRSAPRAARGTARCASCRGRAGRRQTNSASPASGSRRAAGASTSSSAGSRLAADAACAAGTG